VCVLRRYRDLYATVESLECVFFEDRCSSSSDDEVKEASKEYKFFVFLLDRSKTRKQSATQLLEEFFDTASQRNVNRFSFLHKAMQQAFIKTNTALPQVLQLKECFQLWERHPKA